ncbi:MAG: pro-sigmaK processing inhibitor BofA family protein [Oscillospiraceae bacterium]|nr:pro-sigmaK processing inhibitor BofA family protein [Oscillospiraceae bacterium]
METLSTLLIIAAVVVFGVLLLKILAKPIGLIFKLLINTLFGFLSLFIINFFGGFIGFTLGVNVLNALIVGVLGVPGVILLALLHFFL